MTVPTPGYKTLLYLHGPATAMVGDACVALADDAAGRKRYQVTNAAHRIMDPTVIPTVKGNGVAIAAANIYNYDKLFGIITFAAAYVPAAPVTVDDSWLSLLAFLQAKESKPSLKRAELGSTVFDQTSSGPGADTAVMGVLTGTITVKSLAMMNDDYDPGAGTSTLWTDFFNGTPKLIQHDPDGANTGVLRAWNTFPQMDESVAATALREMSITGRVSHQSPASWITAGCSFGAP